MFYSVHKGEWQEKIGRFLSYSDGSNQSLYYQTDSSTRRTAANAKISPQQKKRSFFSPELSIHIFKRGRTAEVLLLTLLKLDQSYFFLQEVVFSLVTESK